MKYPIVYIQWRDATSVDAWELVSEAIAFRAHLIHSVGWLIAEDKEQIMIALNFDPDSGDASQYLIIPRNWCEVLKTLRSPA
jgi:hypothetical protein